MDFENIVMYYLAAQGLFLSPKFPIKDGGGEWSCPDFVALDFNNHQVQVIEVTTAYDVSGLIAKIQDRNKQWFERLQIQLLKRGVIDTSWKFIVRVFVRKDREDTIRAKFQYEDDVSIEIIEKIAFSWKWPWDEWSKS
ncbi:MAG: hypothetical protein EHM36_16065 [Deltaproteobacteria bacterium]|nr:MAG: hypothetical protein EHM36_16065 [Deltaproteobacteria bacterium]